MANCLEELNVNNGPYETNTDTQPDHDTRSNEGTNTDHDTNHDYDTDTRNY